MAQLEDVALFDDYRQQVEKEFADLSGRRLLYETIRRMLSDQVYDVLQATQSALEQHAPASVDAVRDAPPLVTFSAPMQQRSTQLKTFLLHHLYRHPQVMQTTDWAKQVVAELFAAYLSRPQEMPEGHAKRDNRPRAVADYIAGMTDRFASREHARLVGQLPAPSFQ